MILNNLKHIYFLGIGGIGMSGLARYFKSMGKNVSGYDKTPTSLTDELIEEGIDVHFEDNLELIPNVIKSDKDNTLIVYTPAIPKEHNEYVYFDGNSFNIKKRAEVLGMITQTHPTIAVAGTHGKTTTSTLIAHVFKAASKNVTAFLGGISKNYNSNILLGSEDSIAVVEADEFDRSFLTLHPDVAIITSIDPDHLDIYGNKESVIESFSLFAKQIELDGTLITKQAIKEKLQPKSNVVTYSLLDETADYFALNIKEISGTWQYDVVTPNGKIESVTLGIDGLHNIENSIAAIAAAQTKGISNQEIKVALASFTGVKRRFDYQVKSNKLVYIDDYAHHPEELKACINAVKKIYPGKKITGIFQPHLFSRTRDFAEGFASSLSLLDEVILMDIYPARELPIEGVSSEILLNNIHVASKKLLSEKEILSEVETADIEVLLTLGAGDIDQLVQPISERLKRRLNE